MNDVREMGNLTKDPERVETTDGKLGAKFTIAVNRPFSKDEVDFLDCVAWGQTAETILKYFTKGKRIVVSGWIKVNNFTDGDGKKRRSWSIQVDKFWFCQSNSGDSSESKESSNNPKPTSNTAQGSSNSYGSNYEEDDMPF